jgi:hypothetical protein
MKLPAWFRAIPKTALGAVITLGGAYCGTIPVVALAAKPLIALGISVMSAGLFMKAKRADEAPKGQKIAAAFSHEKEFIDNIRRTS